jgi:ADP-heptose:LPS heptosyltransferase/glycosyltransferase involved in cell wall biosynthesis
MSIKICIGMIAKNEERDLPRCLKSLEGVADGLVLVDTGSTDRTMEIAREWAVQQGIRYSIFFYTEASEQDETGDWKLWDFSKARNQFVETIEKMGFDYVLWMDADDDLKDGFKIRELPKSHPDVNIHAVQMVSGGMRWPHHRLWKTGLGIRFQGRCHEYPHFGTTSSLIHDDIEIHHDAAPPEIGENSNPRNLRILAREFAEAPTPRCAFYLGNTYKDAGRWEEAVVAYKKRMEFGFGYIDEYYFAALYLGRCQNQAKQTNNAKATFLKAANEKPDWAEFWMELCYGEYTAGNYQQAIEYANKARDMPITPTHLFRERNMYLDQPYRTLSFCYERLGDIKKAIKCAEMAKIKIGEPDLSWNRWMAHLNQLSERRVCWNRPGAIGDVLMTLHWVSAWKKKYPKGTLIYQCAEPIKHMMYELMLRCGVDEVVSTEEDANADETINLVGYPLNDGYPHSPMKKHLMEYFGNELGLSGKAKLKLTPDMPADLVKPYVTIHPCAGWSPYKNWPMDRWEEVCLNLLQQNIDVWQIGGPDDPKLKNVTGMVTGFNRSLAMLSYAKLHLGVDSWTNHATNIEWEGKGKTKGVILWGSTQASAAGYPHNANISIRPPCQPCFKEDPKISRMPLGPCNNGHLCMDGIDVDTVMKAITSTLSN